MDHLATYIVDKVELLQIPFLAKSTDLAYDGKGFYDFPKRVGFDVTELWAPSLDSSIPDEARLTFLQSWLYFAFAHEAFGFIIDDIPLPLTPITLLRKKDNGYVLDSSNLIMAVVAWMAVAEYEDEEKRKQRIAKLTSLLGDVRNIMAAITNAMDAQISSTYDGDLADSNGPKVLFSICLLAEQIDAGFDALYDDYRGILMMRLWPMARSVKQSYLKWAKVCDTEWRHLTRSSAACHTMTAFHFIMQQIIPTKPHTECTKEICRSVVLEQSQRTTLHVHEKCNCDVVKLGDAGQALLQMMVEGRKTPMIMVSDITDSKKPAASIEVLEYTASEIQLCFALSYVCSDQIGFPEANSILACQLLKIHRRIAEIAHRHEKWKNRDVTQSMSIGFWMDTLCIPSDPVLKQKALIQMHHIYRDVNAVLVVERSLEHANTDHGNLTAIYQIYMSIWNRRLWTLQEGILNSNTRFLLEDDDIPIEHLLWLHDQGDALTQPLSYTRQYLAALPNTVGTSTPNKMPVTLLDPIYRSLRIEMMELRLATSSHERRSDHLFHQLAFRQTTEPNDETLCLAILLDLDLATFQTLSFEQQMVQILTKFGQFRSDIIFDLTPRLNTVGFRWAPKTLLGRAAQEGMRTGGFRRAVLGPRGLIVSLPAIVGTEKKIQFTISPVGLLSDELLGVQVGDNWYRVVSSQQQESLVNAVCSGQDGLLMILLESSTALETSASVGGCIVRYINTEESINSERDITYVQPLLMCMIDRDGQAAGMAGMAANRVDGSIEGDGQRLPRTRAAAEILPRAFVSAKFVEPRRYCLV